MAGENEILNYEASCNSGFCNKVPLTGYLINNNNVFLKTGRLEVQDQVAAWSGSGEGPLAGYGLLTSQCVLTWWNGLRSSPELLSWDINLISEGSVPVTQPPVIHPPPNPVPWALCF